MEGALPAQGPCGAVGRWPWGWGAPQGLAGRAAPLGLHFVFCCVSAACSVSFPESWAAGSVWEELLKPGAPEHGAAFWKILPPTWLWMKVQVPCREVLAGFFDLEAGLRIPGDPCPTHWVLPCTLGAPCQRPGPDGMRLLAPSPVLGVRFSSWALG